MTHSAYSNIKYSEYIVLHVQDKAEQCANKLKFNVLISSMTSMVSEPTFEGLLLTFKTGMKMRIKVLERTLHIISWKMAPDSDHEGTLLFESFIE